MRKLLFILALMAVLPVAAQVDAFEQFRQQQAAQFNQFKSNQQAEYDAFRRRVNEEYAEFMRRAWQEFPAHEAEEPKKEPTVEPVVYEEPEPEPKPAPAEPTEEPIVKEDIAALDIPKKTLEYCREADCHRAARTGSCTRTDRSGAT